MRLSLDSRTTNLRSHFCIVNFFFEFQQQKLLSHVNYVSVEFRREREQIGEQPWLIG